jgi:cytochrome c biogenesis protein CcmG/thiol:disulfide interchange protein DsbE
MAKYTKNKRRKSKKKSPLPLILIGIGLIVIAVALVVFAPKEGDAKSAAPGEINSPAPALTLTDIQGETVSLADYRGQWVLVNNWATWCPPCRAEMPELNAYYEAHKDEGFVLIGISAGDTHTQVVDFTDALGIQFPMWVDPQQEALRAFQMSALPNSFVIDPEGNVRLVWTGAVTLDTLEQKVTPLLQQ